MLLHGGFPRNPPGTIPLQEFYRSNSIRPVRVRSQILQISPYLISYNDACLSSWPAPISTNHQLVANQPPPAPMESLPPEIRLEILEQVTVISGPGELLNLLAASPVYYHTFVNYHRSISTHSLRTIITDIRDSFGCMIRICEKDDLFHTSIDLHKLHSKYKPTILCPAAVRNFRLIAEGATRAIRKNAWNSLIYDIDKSQTLSRGLYAPTEDCWLRVKKVASLIKQMKADNDRYLYLSEFLKKLDKSRILKYTTGQRQLNGKWSTDRRRMFFGIQLT